MISTFWGRTFEDWSDIYFLLKFRGADPKSFKDLIGWRSPDSPQGCVNLAFDLAEAREAKYENPIHKWAETVMQGDRRDPRHLPDELKRTER